MSFNPIELGVGIRFKVLDGHSVVLVGVKTPFWNMGFILLSGSRMVTLLWQGKGDLKAPPAFIRHSERKDRYCVCCVGWRE